jgi:hypothetical protein
VQSLRSATSPEDIRSILSAFGIDPDQSERS